ncbi:hypothetical protein Acj9p039 [Acinetobacter phage Acj9]|uniref:Uncharacterized protein n=1 Tax=Acinetobacter phage Acj9 TaxID=760939 RepID=E5EPH3_9CAUD|nr:hypothetical protein Acj9p039 [Acinetobacter phage Acj9]ADG59939.1 hypothetical protein Acj9p039 [Acinetobacter phage Acj9]
MKLLHFTLESDEQHPAKLKFSYAFRDENTSRNTTQSVSKDGILMAIRRLSLLRTHKDAVVSSEFNFVHIPGKIRIDRKRGVCDVIEGIIPTYTKFFIANSFPKNRDNLVFPVDDWPNPDTLWENPVRWEYVDHMISELEKLLKMWDN